MKVTISRHALMLTVDQRSLFPAVLHKTEENKELEVLKPGECFGVRLNSNTPTRDNVSSNYSYNCQL